MSRDTALALLLEPIRRQRAPALWALDEHGADMKFGAPNPLVSAIANRIDVTDGLARSGWQAKFNDFDFSSIPPASLDTVFFRLAKEKPVTHHIINAAANMLMAGGRLWLTGTKQQGIKTYAKHAAQRLGGSCDIKKHGNDYIAVIVRGAAAGDVLDDKDYTRLRVCAGEHGIDFYTKPGLYGWDKIDPGSELLANCVAELFAWQADDSALSPLSRTRERIGVGEVESTAGVLANEPPASILDLGCGYGYLSIMAQRRFRPPCIIATDNNAAALLACAKNFEAYDIHGEVVADDCAARIQASFDLVLCNPPFHQGFGVERDLTEKFIAAARRLCAPEGMAVFVVNVFIPLERLATAYFARVTVLANDGRFKVVQMQPSERGAR